MKKFIALVVLVCTMTVLYGCSNFDQSNEKPEPNKKELVTMEREKRFKEAETYFHEVSENCEVLESLFTDVPGAHTIIAHRDNNEDPGQGGNDRVAVDFVDKDGSSG